MYIITRTVEVGAGADPAEALQAALKIAAYVQNKQGLDTKTAVNVGGSLSEIHWVVMTESLHRPPPARGEPGEMHVRDLERREVPRIEIARQKEELVRTRVLHLDPDRLDLLLVELRIEGQPRFLLGKNHHRHRHPAHARNARGDLSV